MKKYIFIFSLALICIAGAAIAQDSVSVAHTVSSDSIPGAGAPWTDWIGWAIGIVVFLFDIIRRIIPTWKGWTIIGKFDEFLDFIAKLFNGMGNKAKSVDGEKAVFKKTKVIVK